MADHYFSVLKGSGLDSNRVVVGTASSGQSVELRVHDGDGHNTLSVNLALPWSLEGLNSLSKAEPDIENTGE